jgi:hypothetical protein
VHIDLDGEGFKGKACDGVLDKFVQACGRNPGEVTTNLKPEYAMETGQETEHSS